MTKLLSLPFLMVAWVGAVIAGLSTTGWVIIAGCRLVGILGPIPHHSVLGLLGWLLFAWLAVAFIALVGFLLAAVD